MCASRACKCKRGGNRLRQWWEGLSPNEQERAFLFTLVSGNLITAIAMYNALPFTLQNVLINGLTLLGLDAILFLLFRYLDRRPNQIHAIPAELVVRVENEARRVLQGPQNAVSFSRVLQGSVDPISLEPFQVGNDIVVMHSPNEPVRPADVMLKSSWDAMPSPRRNPQTRQVVSEYYETKVGSAKVNFAKKYLRKRGVRATKENVYRLLDAMDVEGVLFQ